MATLLRMVAGVSRLTEANLFDAVSITVSPASTTGGGGGVTGVSSSSLPPQALRDRAMADTSSSLLKGGVCIFWASLVE